MAKTSMKIKDQENYKTKGQQKGKTIPYNGRSPQRRKPYSAPLKSIGKESVEIVKKKVITPGGQDLSMFQAD